MVYPTINEKYELDDLNSNFLELYNQMNVAQSYTPTASNLGTVTTQLAIRKGGVGRYKLVALATFLANTNYTICTLSTNYRPTVEVQRIVFIRSGIYGILIIGTNGNVIINSSSGISNATINVDETYTI